MEQIHEDFDLTVQIRPGVVSLQDAAETISTCTLNRECDAIATFSSLARVISDGRRVISCEYEAYLPMAHKVISKIVREARHKWPSLCACVVVHRTGNVEVGEIALVIVVASSKRREALDAVSWVADSLCAQAPIWVKEKSYY